MPFIGNKPSAVPLTSSDITDGIITTSKIADDAVTTGKITDGTISTVDIADVNITQGKIADQSINEAKMQVSNSPTNGYFLSAQSGNTGGLTWAEASGGTNTPNFEVKKSSGQTLSDNTWTKMTFQSETFDSDSAMDLGNDKFTVPSNKGGKYFFYCSILWNGDDRGYRRVGLYKNGSLEKVLTTTHTNSYDGAAISAGALLNLSASDYIEVYAGSFNNGDPEDVEGDANASYFGGYRIIE